MDKEVWHEYTMEHHSIIKNKQILPFSTMDLEGTVLSEMSDRERQMQNDLTYMQNILKNQNKQAKKPSNPHPQQIYRNKRSDLQLPEARVGGGGIDER